MLRNEAKSVVLKPINGAKCGVADLHHVREHRCKHRLKITRRAADDLQHLRRGRLLVQRVAEVGGALTQLIAQSRVLDGDDSLGGEVSYKFNLLIGETAHLLAIKSDYADEFTFLKQGRVKKSTDTTKVNECDEVVVTLFVSGVFCAVCNVKQLLRHRRRVQGRHWSVSPGGDA